MSDSDTPVSETPEGAAQASPGEAWREVLDQLGELGDAVARWAKAAVNDPDVRAHASELKQELDNVVAKAGETIDKAAESDVGQKIKGAADRVGEELREVGDKFDEKVAPKIASAFRSAAEKLGGAASKMEDKAKDAGEQPPADAGSDATPPAAD